MFPNLPLWFCLFLVFILTKKSHCLVGAVLIQEVTRSQAENRDLSVVMHGGGWGRRSCAVEFDLHLPSLNQTIEMTTFKSWHFYGTAEVELGIGLNSFSIFIDLPY